MTEQVTDITPVLRVRALAQIQDELAHPENHYEVEDAVVEHALTKARYIAAQMGWHISDGKAPERRSAYPPCEMNSFDRLEFLEDDEEIPCTLAPGTGTTAYTVKSQKELEEMFPGTQLKL